METIFGTEMPFAAKILLALMIVIGLAAGAFYMVRRFGAAGFGVTTLRGRQPRLALIEVAGVDARRSLVLIRRDNVEHLLMIGGPTDVVVEPNIVRAVAVGARETSARNAAEVAPRPSATSDAALWPPQSDAPPPRPQRQPPLEEPVARQPPQPSQPQTQQPQPEPAAARVPHPSDPLGALAAELGRTAAQSDRETVPPPREPKRSPQIVPAPQSATAADSNLTEMALRLEAALRHAPGGRTEPVLAKAAAPEISVGSRLNGNSGAVEAARVAASDSKAPRTDVKPGAPNAVYDSLEAEMASLLGRPATTKV
jgi:flagellar protein FliO/FliZ